MTLDTMDTLPPRQSYGEIFIWKKIYTSTRYPLPPETTLPRVYIWKNFVFLYGSDIMN
jgi:hypothetical protein